MVGQTITLAPKPSSSVVRSAACDAARVTITVRPSRGRSIILMCASVELTVDARESLRLEPIILPPATSRVLRDRPVTWTKNHAGSRSRRVLRRGRRVSADRRRELRVRRLETDIRHPGPAKTHARQDTQHASHDGPTVTHSQPQTHYHSASRSRSRPVQPPVTSH